MPQLDTVYTFTIYFWTWFTLYIMAQKTKTVLIMKRPKTEPHPKTKNLTPTLPWT